MTDSIKPVLYSDLPEATILKDGDQFFVIQDGLFYRFDKKLITNATLTAETGSGTDTSTPAVASTSKETIFQIIWNKIRQLGNAKQSNIPASTNNYLATHSGTTGTWGTPKNPADFAIKRQMTIDIHTWLTGSPAGVYWAEAIDSEVINSTPASAWRTIYTGMVWSANHLIIIGYPYNGTAIYVKRCKAGNWTGWTQVGSDISVALTQETGTDADISTPAVASTGIVAILQLFWKKFRQMANAKQSNIPASTNNYLATHSGTAGTWGTPKNPADFATQSSIGALSSLNTNVKTNIVAAINEVNGKSALVQKSGTWTPSASGVSNGVGRWYQIGKLVTFHIRVTITSSLPTPEISFSLFGKPPIIQTPVIASLSSTEIVRVAQVLTTDNVILATQGFTSTGFIFISGSYMIEEENISETDDQVEEINPETDDQVEEINPET